MGSHSDSIATSLACRKESSSQPVFTGSLRILGAVLFMVACGLIPCAAADVPVVKGDLGPCSADFTVTDSASKPLYDAFTMTTVATFELPWRLAFLPDGRMLITEKIGPVWLVSQR